MSKIHELLSKLESLNTPVDFGLASTDSVGGNTHNVYSFMVEEYKLLVSVILNPISRDIPGAPTKLTNALLDSPDGDKYIYARIAFNHEGKNHDLTPSKGANFRILATVINIIKYTISTNPNLVAITFEGKNSESSRIRLYDSLTEKAPKVLGYQRIINRSYDFSDQVYNPYLLVRIRIIKLLKSLKEKLWI